MSKFVSNSTMIPNAFIDECMANISDKAIRIYLVIIRKTTGWHKVWDSISITQFQQITGIKDERTIRSALSELIKLGLIKTIAHPGKTTQYALNLIQESDTQPPASDAPPTRNAPPTRHAGTPPASDVGTPPASDAPHKRNIKKLTKEKEKIPKRKSTTISFENLPTGISVEAAEAFIDYRKTMKKPLTQRAFDLNMAIAAKAGSIGITPDQAIDMTILAVWQGINLKWIADRMKKNEAHQHSGKQYKTKPKFDPNEMLDRQQAAIMGSGCSSHSYSGFPENDGDLRSSMDEKSYDSECIELSPSGMGEWS